MIRVALSHFPFPSHRHLPSTLVIRLVATTSCIASWIAADLRTNAVVVGRLSNVNVG
jgi:hypothetical protein